MYKVRNEMNSDTFEGSAPSVFVGRQGYPDVNVGILSPAKLDDSAWQLDAPRHWSENDLDIPSIIGFRSSLVNSRVRESIKASSRFLDIAKEVACVNQMDLDVKLKRRPFFQTSFEATAAPSGPLASLDKIKVIGNPKVPQKIDKVVSDTDLLSTKGMGYLYTKGFDENDISKLLSIGNLGVGKNRKMVPTRWSITAVDDQLGKQKIERIKEFSETGDMAFFGGHLGNYFLIMFVPDNWGYELFEMYMPKVSWNTTHEIQYTTDHEFYQGRKTYAQNCAGGYYAARLPILDKLTKMKRQTTAVVMRFITGEYSVPLGVWVVREAVRKALNSRPLDFSSTDLMLKYAQALVKKKFGHDISDILRRSRLLNERKKQRRLSEF